MNVEKNNWTVVKIPDVLFFQEGPGVRNWQFRNSGVKLLNVGNINYGSINLDSTDIFISEDEANSKYSHFLIDEGDLLIACSGIVVENFHNKIAFIKREHLPLCLNTSTMRFKVLDSNKINLNYFKYFLQSTLFTRQLKKLITGSAQLNFGPSHIKKIKLPLPPLATQKHIADILDAADALRRKTQQIVDSYDELAQSLFLEMFGDPVRNEKGWEKKELKKFGKIITGNTPSRDDDSNYSSNFIEWIKTDNILADNLYVSKASEHLSEKGLQKGRMIEANSLLVACIAGSVESIGRAALTNRPVAFNQQINGIQPHNDVSPFFLYTLFKVSKKYIQSFATNGMKRLLVKSQFESIPFIKPPLDIQLLFDAKFRLIEQQKELAKQSLAESENLFNAQLQKAFKGELVPEPQPAEQAV